MGIDNSWRKLVISNTFVRQIVYHRAFKTEFYGRDDTLLLRHMAPCRNRIYERDFKRHDYYSAERNCQMTERLISFNISKISRDHALFYYISPYPTCKVKVRKRSKNETFRVRCDD